MEPNKTFLDKVLINLGKSIKKFKNVKIFKGRRIKE
jgi:hypothetical protein